jgi:transcriptional regulator with XRE-family HTH domain
VLLASPIPAKAIIALRRLTNRQIAADLGVSPAYVGRVLNGQQLASRRFREALADYLDRPRHELFDDEVPAENNA